MPIHGQAILAMGKGGRSREIVLQLEALLAQHSASLQAPGDNPVPRTASLVATGWDAIDRALAPALSSCNSDALAKIARGGLARGAIHEWIDQSESTARRHRNWTAPHSLFIHLAWRAIESDESGLIAWIGRRVWPHARTLEKIFTTETRRHGVGFGMAMHAHAEPWNAMALHAVRATAHLRSRISNFKFPSSVPPCLRGEIFPEPIHNRKSPLAQSIFINPPDDVSRLWAIDLALHNHAVNVVIADGSRFKMAESRRLQLAAERGMTLALLAKPSWETGELSAAATRWRVRRTPSPTSAPRWIVELLRCKQLQGRSRLQTPHMTESSWGGWEVERDAQGHIRLVADVVGRSDQAKNAATYERTA